MSTAPAELYATGLEHEALRVCTAAGTAMDLPVKRWLRPAGPVDARVLTRARGPVLDVGCGPGRHVTALARRGVLALGVDIAPAAVGRARSRGAAVMLGSVFAPVPGAGHWRTALLLDGNIGIGGRPVALLQRLRALLSPQGMVICELEPDRRGAHAEMVRLQDLDGRVSQPFRWAWVGSDAMESIAAAAGLHVEQRWQDEGRCFTLLGVGSSPSRIDEQRDQQRLPGEQP